MDKNTIDKMRKELEELTPNIFSTYVIEISNKKKNKYDRNDYSHIPNKIIWPNSIAIEYEIGGHTGGNCWNNNEPELYYRDKSELPNLYDHLFLPVCMVCEKYIEITKLSHAIKFISGLNSIIKTDTRIENEYYGNDTIYEISYLLIDEIIKLCQSI